MSLWIELKRRNVFRVAAAYAVVAWLLVQVGDIAADNLGFPGWFMPMLFVVLGLGFPVALVFAWAFEITPEGIKRERDVDREQSITRDTARRLDLVTIIVVTLAVALLAVDRFWLAGAPQPVTSVAAAAQDPREPGTAQPAANNSIAVLPFVNMSPDPEQEYFSDGLSEEILNLLAQIRELRVSGRTSSFSFKGKDTPIPEIARTLGVAHILEGSVRKAGDRLRITAQLVKADDGFHLWSESYDRRLEDVFAIQTEIAGAIAEALKLSLVGQDQAAPTVQVAASMPAYERYLQARRLIQGRTRAGLEAARGLLAEALELDPDYAPAHAEAAKAVLLLADTGSSYGDIPAAEAAAAARAHLDRALALDPELAEAHAATGLLYQTLGDFERSDAALARALDLNPSLSDALNWRANNLGTAGRLGEALAARRQLAERDPLNLANLANLSLTLAWSGQPDEALAVARRLQRGFPDSALGFRREAIALQIQGRLAEAEAAAVPALAMAPGDPGAEDAAGAVFYALGEYPPILNLPRSTRVGPARVALGRTDEAIAQARERAAAAPADLAAAWGQLATLSATGRHQAVLDEYRARWGSPAALAAYFGNFPVTAEVAPIAAAQHALGQSAALAETLAHWGERLALLRAQGYAYGDFVIEEAHHRALAGEREAALAKVTEAIDLGYRNPLLARDPAFAPLAEDPAFQAQAQRNRDLIDAERAKLGLEPLP